MFVNYLLIIKSLIKNVRYCLHVTCVRLSKVEISPILNLQFILKNNLY